MKYKGNFQAENLQHLTQVTIEKSSQNYTLVSINSNLSVHVTNNQIFQLKIVEQRLCISCNVIQDEFHFVLKCTAHEGYLK